MVLSKNRTRNDETLRKLALQLTEVNGELEFLASLQPRRKDRQALVEARCAELLALRASFFTVIKLYRDDLDPEMLGSTFKWMKPFGRKATARTVSRYLAARSGMAMQT